MIKVFAVSGFKNSGKTTLCMKLLKELDGLGVRAGYIKRTSEECLSASSTDTGMAVAAGIRSLLWGPDGLIMESRGAEWTVQQLVSEYFPDAEIVIIEGGKTLKVPRIWVDNGMAHPGVDGIFAVYDRNGHGDGSLSFGAGDERLLAERLAASVRGKFYRSAKVYIGGSPLPMKDFIADFIRGAVLGMLSSLKGGGSPQGTVRIYLEGDKKNNG